MRIFKYTDGFFNIDYGILNGVNVFKCFDNNMTPCQILCRGIIIDILRTKQN